MATAIRRAWQKGQSGSCAALVRCGSCSNLHTKHNFPHRTCQRHCSQAISRAAATPSAKKNKPKKRASKNQAKPAQKSDRTASKARSRVVLASISPVHGSAARLLAAAGPGSSGHSRLPQPVFKTFELLAVFLGRQIQRHRREAPKAADRDIRIVLLILPER